jgi:hypothetical protein
VQAVNAQGSSAFTATVSCTTAAPVGNYLLTLGTRPTNGPFVHGQTGIAEGVNDNSISGDGSHTVPASVWLAWSLSNSVVPTTGLQSLSVTTMDGHNQWVNWVAAPGSAGNYYMWFVAKDGAGTVVATYVSPSTYSVT